MRDITRMTEVVIAACALGGCATTNIPPSETLLSEDQVIDLMEHPQKWDDRIVTIKIYPYDHGDPSGYAVCFEKCDAAYAEKSPFLILTTPNRFKGLKGNHAIIVKARYSSACFYRSTLCADTRFGLFTEIE